MTGGLATGHALGRASGFDPATLEAGVTKTSSRGGASFSVLALVSELTQAHSDKKAAAPAERRKRAAKATTATFNDKGRKP